MSSSGEMGGGFAGRKEGQRSNFSVTCNLLSRYLREKGSFGDVGLDLARSLDARGNSRPRTPRTMDLLPATNPKPERPLKSSNTAALPDLNATKGVDASVLFRPNPPALDVERKPEPQAPQLTIFYGGKVLVFDNFPVDKAMELVAMAGTSPAASQTPAIVPDRSTCPPPQNATPASTSCNKPVGITTSTTSTVPPECPPRPAHLPIASDLPIARRVSLNRFLEKRKGRINAKAPYQVEGSPDLVSSSSMNSGSSKDASAAGFPGFDKAEESAGKSGVYGKRDKAAVVTVQSDGKPEPIVDLSAFGLAIPSSSEFDARR